MFGSTVFLDDLNLSCCVEMIDMTVLVHTTQVNSVFRAR